MADASATGKVTDSKSAVQNILNMRHDFTTCFDLKINLLLSDKSKAKYIFNYGSCDYYPHVMLLDTLCIVFTKTVKPVLIKTLTIQLNPFIMLINIWKQKTITQRKTTFVNSPPIFCLHFYCG